MFDKNGILVTKAALALSLALGASAIYAQPSGTSDEALVSSIKAALHSHPGGGLGIRVQAIDGVVYLYGTADTYSERVNIEEAVSAAAQGHKIVDSIDFGSN
jgi:hypothetical protein